MPKIVIGQDHAWRSAEDLASKEDATNRYTLKPGGRVVVHNLETGEEKYVATHTTCTCPAGQFNRLCKHRKAVAELQESLGERTPGEGSEDKGPA